MSKAEEGRTLGERDLPNELDFPPAPALRDREAERTEDIIPKVSHGRVDYDSGSRSGSDSSSGHDYEAEYNREQTTRERARETYEAPTTTAAQKNPLDTANLTNSPAVGRPGSPPQTPAQTDPRAGANPMSLRGEVNRTTSPVTQPHVSALAEDIAELRVKETPPVNTVMVAPKADKGEPTTPKRSSKSSKGERRKHDERRVKTPHKQEIKHAGEGVKCVRTLSMSSTTKSENHPKKNVEKEHGIQLTGWKRTL